MYEWLDKEIGTIRSQRFHCFDRRPRGVEAAAVLASSLPVPDAYKSFVIRFGRARLYRLRFRHLIEIFAAPRHVPPSGESDEMYLFAFSWIGAGRVAHYFVANQRPVQTVHSLTRRHLKDSGIQFEPWLESISERARKKFTRAEWDEIRAGPAPFTREEQAIAAARAHFTWDVVGIDEEGRHILTVRNSSSLRLPAVTLRVFVDGEEYGYVRVPVPDLAPNQAGEVRVSCYDDRIDPRRISLEEIEPLVPEDRGTHWEFGA